MSTRPASSLALMEDLHSGPAVEVTLALRPATLARIDTLCEACKPVEMTREKMLQLMVETGVLYWESNAGADGAEDVALAPAGGANLDGTGGDHGRN